MATGRISVSTSDSSNDGAADFAKVMAVIGAGCQVHLSDEALEVYYAMLGDLPPKVLMIAGQKALLQPLYGKFPSIELLRRMAVEATAGEEVGVSPGEAWQMATRACWGCDIEVEGSVDRAFAKVPPLVRRAVEQFGFRSLYDLPGNSIETARAQFTRIYERIVAQEREQLLLPPAVRRQLAEVEKLKELKPAPVVAKVLAGIGKEKA